MTRRAFELTVGAVAYHLAELTPDELLLCLKAGGTDTPTAAELAVALEGLRMSLRRVGDGAVSYAGLQGPGLTAAVPRTRHINQLVLAWRQLHLPTDEELAAARASLSVSDDGQRELYTVTLPGGPAVTFREQRVGELLAAARVGDRERSPGARTFAQGLASLRASITAIDGAPPGDLAARWPFGAKATYLLARVWDDVHLGQAEEVLEVLGGVKPVAAGG